MRSDMRPWTGRAIYKIKNANNKSRNVLSAAGRRHLQGQLRKALGVYAIERKIGDKKIYSVKHKVTRRSRIDILETFAGQANITKRSHEFNLKAMRPIDYATGYDLNTTQHQQKVDFLIDTYEPLFLIQGIDCCDWCLLQDNVNYIRRKIALLMRRAKARKMLRKAVRWCVRQLEAGRFFLIENPTTSRLWLEPCIQKLLALPGVGQTVCHAGAYGATNSRGDMIRKGHRFVGNCPLVLEALSKRLTPEEQKMCVPLQGRDTTLSQHYPPDMVTAILDGIAKTVQELYPRRALWHVHLSTFFVQDVTLWKEVFEQAAHTVDHTRAKSLNIMKSDTLWKTIQELTGWNQLERVQLALQPTMFRFLTHIPHTHRGAALRYTDGSTEVYQEDIGEVRHPRARFRKPVHYAVFFYGYQDEHERQADGQEQPSEDPQLRRDHMQDIEISFPGRTPLTQEVKTTVSRLHRNLGHPRAAELKKILAMNAVKNPAIYEAVERLTCVSCERTRDPFRPNIGSAPASGFYRFADVLQMDIVYVRDVTSKNFMFLGVIDETTHLHSLMSLETRQPEDVSRALQLGWIRNFGAPLRIKTDPDGSFRGSFESDMDSLGTFVDYVPAEAHHKIGLIERHNATARAIMERIVDSNAAVGYQQMELIAVATTIAKNSCTWSAGRPPYVAAFGRIPRIGMNLLSDENGLVVGETRAEAQQLADKMRVEAQQYLAQMSISSTFRRALLRKTAPEPDLDAPIGSIIAYWRWTARSGKKRGGFKLGRLLGRDPDHRSLWIQSGTNTIRVDPSQCRQARGFEQWCPDADDIKALHLATDNLQKGVIQDETLPEEAARHQHFDFDENDVAEEFPATVAPAETDTGLPLIVQQPRSPRTSANTRAQLDPYQIVNQYNTSIYIHQHTSKPSYKQQSNQRSA